MAIGTSYFFGGRLAMIGMTLGIAATTFNLVALALAIRTFSRMMADQDNAFWPTAGILAAFFAKVPVLIVVGMYARSLGPVAFDPFIVGLLLVYSALVGRALSPQ